MYVFISLWHNYICYIFLFKRLTNILKLQIIHSKYSGHDDCFFIIIINLIKYK